MTSGEFATTQFCAGADLAVQLLTTPAAAQGTDPVTLQIEIKNQGPSPATEVLVRVRVPTGSTLTLTQPGAWDCTATVEELQCKRSLIPVGETSPIEVTLTPPFGASSIPITAELTAETPDPDSSNNGVTLPLGNAAPVTEKLLGGGLSCGLAGRTDTQSARTAFGAALGALLLAFARRRQRV